VSGLLAGVRANQSVLPPRPFVSVTVTGLPGDAVVVFTVRLGGADVDVGVTGGGVLEMLGAATLKLTLFDAHTAFVQETGLLTTTARVP